MFHEIITENDRIAVIAPHPDDECIGAASVLLKAPELTVVYVLTDGRYGNRERSAEEEIAIRSEHFEAEMEYVKPHAWYWLGIEDTKLNECESIADKIDFTQYTKIFIPEIGSAHPDHVAAAQLCCDAMSRQGAQAECYAYEVCTPFHDPGYYIDLTGLDEEKRRLIRFHRDQASQEKIALSLNAFRAAQMIYHDYEYVECFEKIDVYSRPDTSDVLYKLTR